MENAGYIAIGSDCNVAAAAAHWTQDGTPANGLTVTFSLFDADNVVVTGAEDLAMTLETNFGDYVGEIPAAVTATLTDGSQYKIVVTATGSGKTRIKSLTVTARAA